MRARARLNVSIQPLQSPHPSAFSSKSCCCSIDVWGIAINITLQDAPFLVFRLLIIAHFKIISYMNVFFTCKNTLVILLQLYRLYVVHSESNKSDKKKKKKKNDFELTDISIISKPEMYGERRHHGKREKRRSRRNGNERRRESDSDTHSEVDDFSEEEYRPRRNIRQQNSKKDTGYSTASSHASHKPKPKKSSKSRESSRERIADSKSRSKNKQKLKRSDTKEVYIPTEKSDSESEEEPRKLKKPTKGKKGGKRATISVSSDPSSD